MKKLLICCIFGNTATALAKKMQKVASERGYHIQISAVGIDNFASVAPAFDCFLVAPHIQYKMGELKKAIKEGQHIEIIDGYSYAWIDAEKVLTFAVEQMAELAE
ncbi:PTS sugar transporter subunit IIB [Pantoea sp. B65]|uniref:PTS sugar transporter subunit IIB n=1 Tax=Pantoea sp. B65 TaxID=2813359 RepID=UPI0039B49472